MGGAVGLLASLELAQHARSRHNGRLRAHKTYTFAAPRLGNAAFARFFRSSFPRSADHWAMQFVSDAVPHLPFAAWGFEHPEGVLRLGETTTGGAACGEVGRARPEALQRARDRGDSVDMLRPRAGKIMDWVSSHDIQCYLWELRRLSPPDAPPQSHRGAHLDWGV